MNYLQKYISIPAVVIGLSIPNLALSATIRFDDAVSDGQQINAPTSYIEAGYKLTSSEAFLTSPTASAAGELGPTTGSDFYSLCVGCNSSTQLTRADGQLFSLNGLDAGIGKFGGDYYNVTFNLSGQRADYSLFNYSFTLYDLQWHTFVFSTVSDFSSLRQLTITATTDWWILESGAVVLSGALDNINVSAVPIPASVWLFGSGLLGLTAARKRKLR